jgi:hypothetical protein
LIIKKERILLWDAHAKTRNQPRLSTSLQGQQAHLPTGTEGLRRESSDDDIYAA